MKCQNHPDKEATVGCVGCGNLFCDDCIVKVKGKNYCKSCVVDLAEKQENIKSEPVQPQIIIQQTQQQQQQQTQKNETVGIICCIILIILFLIVVFSGYF